MTYAKADLNKDSYQYCIEERDQAELTVQRCEAAKDDCEKMVDSLHDSMDKQKQIIDIQTQEIVSKDKEIEKVESSSTAMHIVYGILGLAVGLLLHVPLSVLGIK